MKESNLIIFDKITKPNIGVYHVYIKQQSSQVGRLPNYTFSVVVDWVAQNIKITCDQFDEDEAAFEHKLTKQQFQ